MLLQFLCLQKAYTSTTSTISESGLSTYRNHCTESLADHRLHFAALSASSITITNTYLSLATLDDRTRILISLMSHRNAHHSSLIMPTRNLLARRTRPTLHLHARQQADNGKRQLSGILDPLLGPGEEEETGPIRRPDPPSPGPNMSSAASSADVETSVRPTQVQPTTAGMFTFSGIC